MRRSRTGSPRPARSMRPITALSAANWSKRCGTARTHIRARRFTARPENAMVWRRQSSCRENSFRTTTSTTLMRLTNASRNSIRPGPRPVSSSSMPTLAVLPKQATLLDAYRKALACDTTSAFGGIVALNRKLDAEAAKAITEIFTEVIIAPEANDEAIKIVAAKKNLRLLRRRRVARSARARGLTVKSVAGGLLVQSRDNAVVDEMQLEPSQNARRAKPSLRSAIRIPRRQACEIEHDCLCEGPCNCRHRCGTDEPRRCGPHCRQEGGRRGERAQAPAPLTKGSVVASDAFFPFPDGLLVAIEAGAMAVIQPGGSVRDDEVIAAADAQTSRWYLPARGISGTRLGHAAPSLSRDLPASSPRLTAWTRSCPNRRFRGSPSGYARLRPASAGPILPRRRHRHDRCRPSRR